MANTRIEMRDMELPLTDEQWCEEYQRLDRLYGTSVQSSLHHDNRCRICNGTSTPADEFVLIDDGTLDTILECPKCKVRERFNFAGDAMYDEAVGSDEARQTYEQWVEDMRDEMADSHECRGGRNG